MSEPVFEILIEPGAPVRRLATGFAFTEGPVWHPVQQCLLFSDIPGNGRYRWSDAGTERIRHPTHHANGMSLDKELNLLVCEHAAHAVSRIGADGVRTVLCSHFDGRELNSPNDICVRSDGSIWFTDPTYGRMQDYGVARETDLDFRGVYRLSPEHIPGEEPLLVASRGLFAQPNGLCFSPCETILYVNDSAQANIRAFEIAPDCSLKPPRLVAENIRDDDDPGVPDGMKTDERGNIWVTAPHGIRVYAPDGTLLEHFAVPEPVGNLHWGGSDWRTLFLCATTSLYAVGTKVRPHTEPFMRY